MLIEPLRPACKREIVDDVFVTTRCSLDTCPDCRRSRFKDRILDLYCIGALDLESAQNLVRAFHLEDA